MRARAREDRPHDAARSRSAEAGVGARCLHGTGLDESGGATTAERGINPGFRALTRPPILGPSVSLRGNHRRRRLAMAQDWNEYADRVQKQLPAAPEPLLDGYVSWVPWVYMILGVIGLVFALGFLVLGAVLSPFFVL